MFHELPWLPLPNEIDRETLRHPDGKGIDQIVALRKIAERQWSGAELTSLGRRIVKARDGLGKGWRTVAADAGLSPFALLFLTSNTSTPLVATLVAAALARGILLDCRNVEYQEPEAWLAQNAPEVKSWQPDATLLSLDRNALRLRSSEGDVVAADQAVQWSLQRIASLVAQIGSLTSKDVIVENLPDSGADFQASIDAWLPGSPRALLSDYNRRLAQASADGSFLLFDVAGISNLVGRATWDAGRYWFTAKLPFSPTCAPLYASRVVNLMATLCGKSRRVLVLDLDNTLWGGVVGDDGTEGLTLGDGSALGGAHAAVQRMALALRSRGVLLCVASKNMPEIAMEAFRSHPEMILKESDIAEFAIGWNSKSESLRGISSSLNLGIESFVFLDDNPFERKQVRDASPGVAVPELPKDPALWLPVFQSAAYFEQTGFSAEDANRAEFYSANAQRANLQEAAGDEQAFQKSLQMKIKIAPFDLAGRQRIAQLIAKSNQFNLTTQRYSPTQIAELESDHAAETLQVWLSDIFGDNGMISVVICKKSPDEWEIDTWLMSCRVLGRHVEQAVLQTLVDRAKRVGAKRIWGRYIPTTKNALVRDHYAKLGFALIEGEEGGESVWSLELDEHTPVDVPIAIVEESRSI